jgi:hypothetical protein
MFQLEPTTLFYYNFSSSAFDKSSAGLIDNWAASVKSVRSTSSGSIQAGSGSRVPVAQAGSKKSESTLVSSKATKVNAQIRKSKNRKPISEPLALVDISDEEWLNGKDSAVSTQAKHSVSTSQFIVYCNGVIYTYITDAP